MIRHCARLDRIPLGLTAGGLVVYLLMALNELTSGRQSGMTQSLSPYLPIFLGTVWAAPLLAREFETGTAAWSWTQGTTRLRWYATRMLLPLTIGVISGVLLTLLVWLSSLRWTKAERQDRMAAQYLVSHGLTLTALCVVAIALGLFSSALLKRVVPAVGVTLAGTVALVYAAQVGLEHLAPVRHMSAASQLTVPGHLLGINRPAGTAGPVLVRFIPDSAFWPTQLLGALVALALTAALVGAGAAAVRRAAW